MFGAFCTLVALCTAALCAPRAASASSQEPEQDPLNNPCFVDFYNNELTRSVSCFERELISKKSDPEAYNHLAQAILYNQLLIHGELESELVSSTNPFLTMPKIHVPAEVADRFKQLIRESLSLSQAELKRNPKNVRALYAFGVAHGLQANYKFLIDKDWIGALHDAAADNKACQQILAIDPGFIDAHLVTGLFKYIVGSLPFYQRAIGFLGGLGSGDKQQGIREVQQVSRHGILDRYDAEVLLAVIYRREHRPKDASLLLKQLVVRFPQNYLFRFEEVEMYSDMGDEDDALDTINEIERLERRHAPGYASIPPAKIDYLRANLLFWYNHLDRAESDLQAATNPSNYLDLGTRSMAWLRLGQVYDLEHDRSRAVEAYRQVVKTEPHSAAAEEAKGYISKPYHRKGRQR